MSQCQPSLHTCLLRVHWDDYTRRVAVTSLPARLTLPSPPEGFLPQGYRLPSCPDSQPIPLMVTVTQSYSTIFLSLSLTDLLPHFLPSGSPSVLIFLPSFFQGIGKGSGRLSSRLAGTRSASFLFQPQPLLLFSSFFSSIFT